jgi:O-antigen/teichoic acid export membrane protein
MSSPERSPKRLVARNVKFLAVSRGITFLVSFALLPLIVSHVGNEVYGAYLLAMTFIGYLGYFDLGVTAAVVKYVAEFMGGDDTRRASKAVAVSFLFFLGVGLLCAAVLYTASLFVHRFGAVSQEHQVLISQILKVTAIASLFIWPGKTFDGVLRGLQRYDTIAKVEIAVRLATLCAAYVVLGLGWGFITFLIVSQLIVVLGNLAFGLLAYMHFKPGKLLTLTVGREDFRTVFGFSLFVFLGSLANIAIFQVDNFVVGAIVSVSAVTLYGVGFTLQGGLRGMNSLLGDPLFPAVAKMVGIGDLVGQRQTLFKATKYMTFVFVPLVIVGVAFAKPLVSSWMGEGFAQSVLPAQILMAFWISNGTVQVASGIVLAKGHAKALFKIGAVTAILNLGISIVLSRHMGMVGVALGTAIPMVFVSSPLVLARSLRILDVGWREYYDHAIRANLGTYGIAAALSVVAATLLPPAHVVVVLLEMGLVYGVALLGGFMVSFTATERREILVLVRGK